MASYADSDRTLTVKGLITYPDTLTQAITSTHISSFNINEDAGRDVPIGAAPASYFLLKLDNSSGQWEPGGSLLGAHSLDGAKVEIEIGLWNGSAYDYSKIGTYYVEDVRGQEHETTITLSGSDAMVPKMSAYFADAPGDYPRTIGALLVDVAAEAGVTLESSIFTNSNVFIPVQPNWRNDLTCRDVVGYIAACAGGIARFNRAGKLEITTLERVASRAISTSVYKRLTRENTTFGALNAINIYAHGAPENAAPMRFATTPATPDTSLNSINIKGNPILANGSSTTSSVGTGMLTALSGMSFRGATFDWHGDPSLVLGKICSVKDLASNSISVLITKQTIKFGAGFEMTSGCDVTTSTKADASGKLQKIFTPTGNLNAEALAGNIYVKAGEKMTLESGSDLNLLAGGNLNIKNLSGTDNVINMDSTGLSVSSTGKVKLTSGSLLEVQTGADIDVKSGGEINVESGGKINLTTANDLMLGAQNITAFADGRIDAKASTIDLSANNSIKLSVSGGTNLLKNSDFAQGSYSAWTNWANYSDAALSKHSQSIDGVKQSGNVTCLAPDTVAGISQYVNCPQPYGDSVTLSFYGYIMQSILTAYGENRCVLITQYDAVGTEIPSSQVSIYPSSFNFVPGQNRFYRLVHSFKTHANARTMRILFMVYANGTDANNMIVTNFQLEKGTQATDWSPAPSDPASGVKTSKIEIGSDFIDIASGGTLTLDAANDIKIGSGSDTLASTIDLSANDSIKLAVTSQSANLFPSDPSNWIQGSISSADGSTVASTTRIRSASNIRLYAGTLYTVSRVKSLTGQIYLHYFNSSNAYIGNSGGWVTTYPYSFSLPSGASQMRVIVRTEADGTIVPTDVPGILFSIVPAGVSGGVKTSKIEIGSDFIDIASGGNLSITSPNTLKITSGTTNATALAVRNDTDYFISAGHLTQSSAPFWVKKDGSIKSISGTIGGFTLASSSLSAQASGKPLLKLDAANSKIQTGVLEILGTSGPYGDAGIVGAGENELNLVGEPVIIGNVAYSLVEITNSVAWFRFDVSALSFTDRTIGYDGNAVADLKRIRNDKDGNIDHSTLPKIAKRTIQAKGKTEEGRDLGAMISILTKAVQELDERIEKIENRTK